MYITMNDIKGEKGIDLSYSIDSDKDARSYQIVTLTLRIRDQNNDNITAGPEVTVVLHIR